MQRRVIPFLVGAVLLVFGFFCLNYTKADTEQRHKVFAARNNLPPPSRPIFYGGALSLALGAGLIGFAVGRNPAAASRAS
ncbi:MAG TPA: hypothetical protein VFB80_01200 [Pirellulaceae bacterium]|nr:hypothetical protein [Pirellulaceae bacterium]